MVMKHRFIDKMFASNDKEHLGTEAKIMAAPFSMDAAMGACWIFMPAGGSPSRAECAPHRRTTKILRV